MRKANICWIHDDTRAMLRKRQARLLQHGRRVSFDEIIKKALEEQHE